jgi:hypothetical protein
MGVGPGGENLIFLISQPRAGSTLLQRILGAHPDVHSQAEPWIMLHPVYALRRDGHSSEYDTTLAYRALGTFLESLPSGEEDYRESLRLMCSLLYDRALAPSGKRYFLDKTPRYYLIVPDLYRIFPNAGYVLLLRNPLAILVSILKSFVREDWFRFAQYRADLMEAPRLLTEARRLLQERATEVRYEQLVANPEGEARRLCRGLGLDYAPAMVAYGPARQPWPFADPRALSLERPVPDYAEAWAAALHDPQVWRLAHEYLERLGPELVGRLGYSYDDLAREVASHRPSRLRLGATFGLDWLWHRPRARDWWRSSVIRLKNAVRRRGVLGVMARGLQVLVPASGNRTPPGSRQGGPPGPGVSGGPPPGPGTH